MLTHERLRVTLHELETTWSLDDLADAHDALDELEKAIQHAHEKLRP